MPQHNNNRQTQMPSRENPLTVQQINAHLKRHVEALGEVWAEGELTEWKHSRGNYYGKLRDLHEPAALSLAMWRPGPKAEGFQPGDRVVVRLMPSYWVGGGQLSFTVKEIDHVGIGKLLEQLAQLRAKIHAAGLAAAERKKPLPFLPRTVGLITGKDSDAERDVLVNAKKRWPAVKFRVINTAVQGENTVPEVLSALKQLDADPAVDVIIIARGGGDFIHLLPFSDERLLYAIAEANTPVVSAIGHEPDNPLLDDVADARASTPTAAGKLVVPDVTEELAKLSVARERLLSRVFNLITTAEYQLQSIRSRPVLARPETLIEQQEQEVARWATRGFELTERRVETARAELASAHGRLRALSPLATLERGYAVAQLPDGRVLTAPGQAPAGTLLRLRLASGRISAVSTADPASDR